MKKMCFFTQNDLTSHQHSTGQPYFEFLRVPDMSAGLYVLPAGGLDGQQPHSEDEIYVIMAGRGEFTCEGETRPVVLGDVIYVPAHADHRFHDIADALEILVFFGPAEGVLHQRRQIVHEGEIEIDTDRTRLDTELIHQFLTTSYWAKGCDRETVARSIQNSLCFGVYEGSSQIGFARVITDFATFAYISDVFVVETHRARGIGKSLVAAMLTHPDLQGVRKWNLHTRDAHRLYAGFGFFAPGEITSYMEFRP